MAPLIPWDATVIDLGSGAGLPGIPVALIRPDVQMILVEPMGRRVRFLDDALAHLGGAVQARVQVERARGETASVRADVVICRAVAPLDRLLPLAARLTDNRGRLLALKGDGAAAEMAAIQASAASRNAVLTRHAVTWPDPATVVEAWWEASPSAAEAAGPQRWTPPDSSGRVGS